MRAQTTMGLRHFRWPLGTLHVAADAVLVNVTWFIKGFTTISLAADHIAWVEVETGAWTGGVSTAAWRGPTLIAVLWPLTYDVATALSRMETDSSHLDSHHLSILDEDP